MGWKEIPLNRLDPDSRRYLETVSRSQGSGLNGVFVREQGTQTRHWILFVIALVVLASTFTHASYSPRGFLLVSQVVALVMMVHCSLEILRARRRVREHGQLCHLKFIDGKGIWWTDNMVLRFLPHRDISNVQPHHERPNGFYRRTDFEIATKIGPTGLRLHEERQAEAFFEYSKAIRGVLDLLQQRKQAPDPALVGMLASRIQQDDDGIQKGKKIPNPRITQPKRGLQFQLPYWAMGSAIMLLGFMSIPAANLFLYQQRLFNLTQSPHAKLYDCNHYLKEFPEGRYVLDVLSTRDQLFYQEAMEIAERDQSPAALRAYLTDTQTWKHRPVAQERIDQFYDEAIAQLKRASGLGQGTEERMVQAMESLLNALKTRVEPVATVEFLAGFDEMPKGEFAVQETAAYERFLEESPNLVTLAELSATQSAMLPVGDVFEPEWRAAREDLILRRLEDSMKGLFNPNLVQLRRGEPGKADLRIEYQIFPQGQLYLVEGDDPYPDSEGRANQVPLGLFRGYDVLWEITMDSRIGERPIRWRKELPAVPQPGIYEAHRQDPAWAPYAVVLHDRFIAAGDELIRSFGMTPPQHPSRYAFRSLLDQEKPGAPWLLTQR